ncbi:MULTISPECIES: sensor histidine kinase [Cyanophyceae]|uniref:sensor histidine kinase n=1 Tax=Cyanophyceae TaxID=3028117 RepID=UPI0016845BE7|nr:ATP-binding protein [Trichocoleus sp. FACHB-40]MBD2005150.1 PAS domain S-box protein [Trichocoleus sp. FACHB-40]
MFLCRDNSSADVPTWVERWRKIQKSLLKRTMQLQQANRELANQIAERRLVEEALRQAEEKYRSIFENAVEGIFQTTPDGRYISANPALAKIYGYASPEELIESLTDIKHKLYVDPTRRDKFLSLLQEREYVREFESQIYRQDGSIIWISENARAVSDKDGKLLFCEGFVTDITGRKLAQANLKASEAKFREQATQLQLTLCELQETQSLLIQNEKLSNLGQLVAGVAHEINNPVNFVCNNLSYANQYAQDLLNLLQLYGKHYPQPVPEIKEEVEAIDLNFLISDFPKTLSSMQMGSDRIQQIVHSLRNFSRIDEPQMRRVDIHEGIDSTLLILHSRLKARGGYSGINVVKEYGELPVVECYAGLLNQVFMNLISNAIDALEALTGNCEDSHSQFPCSAPNPQSSSQSPVPSPQSSIPTIRISTEVLNDNQVAIRIIDNGPGMTEEVRCRIFEAFYTTKPTGKGTGLGLSISYQIIVEKHNGKIECISAPAQGTEFIIKIPIRQ